MDSEARLGKNNTIGPFCYIGPGVTIGDFNTFIGHSAIGFPAEHRDYFHTEGAIVIGNRNMIREFVTVHGGTRSKTTMGNNCVMLRGSHLSHDSILEDCVNVSCNVLIGGETYVMEGANLGLGCVIHQRQTIGSWCMVGMGAVVTKDFECLPGNIYVGNPAKYLKRNHIGLDRNQIGFDDIKMEMERYESIRTRVRP